MSNKLMNRKIRVIQRIFTLIGLIVIFISCESVERDIYQIKIYRLNSSDQELRMDKFLEKAYIPALKRIGIQHIGVFKEIAEIDSANKLIYVFIPFKTIKQFEQLEGKLKIHNKYLVDGKDYIDSSHDNPPYERIESILLRSFDSMKKYGVPNHKSANSERIYELRSYQAATEKLYQKKVEMFNSGGESKIFIDLGFQPIFFGEVISGSSMPNLMYLTTFENKTSHEKLWDAFRNSPEWLVLKEEEQYKNTVSKNEKFYLYPTDYSEL